MKLTYIEDDQHPTRHKYEVLKNAPIAEQRFKFFGNDVYAYQDVSRMETDTHVYWAQTVHTPKWNVKTGLYIKNDSSVGCTYEKSTKKFKWWYGKQIILGAPQMYRDMCKYFGAEWFMEEVNGLKISTTNSVFARVLKGKITNTHELIKGIMSSNPSLRAHAIDTDKVLAYVTATNNRVQTIADYVEVAEDINVLLDEISQPHFNFSWKMHDLVKYARMLNRKIDFSWDGVTINSTRTVWEREVEIIRREWLPLYSF